MALRFTCFGLAALALATTLTLPALAEEPGADAGARGDEARKEDGPRSPWVYGGAIGVPKLESGAFRLVGDGNLGYAREHWGMQGGLAFASYAANTQRAFSSTAHNSGGVEAWYSPASPEDRLGYQLRGELSYASYATTYIMTGDAAAAGGGFSSETSGMTRATALAGGRYRVSSMLAVTFLGGLGLQAESYSTASEAGAGASMSSSVRYTARLGATWVALPDKLRVRALSDIGYYSITRTRLVVDSEASATGEPLQRESFKQLEMSNRVFGEITSLTFAGITPAVFAGLDVVSLSGDAGSDSTLVPLGGIGFVSPTP